MLFFDLLGFMEEKIEKNGTKNDKVKKDKVKKVVRILDLVFNIVFIPFIFLTSIFTFSIVISKLKTGVASVFGYTQMEIVSGSMQDAGFYIGDKIFVKAINAQDLRVGDYIAFYQYSDPECPTLSIVSTKNTPRSKPKGRIVFHAIKKIEKDINGDFWFTTKGTNNLNEDSVKIYEDYVIGKWVEEDNFLTSFITFITSPIGIISLVAIPCSLIITVDVYQLIIYSYQYRQLIINSKQIDSVQKTESSQTKSNQNNLAQTESSQTKSNQNNPSQTKKLKDAKKEPKKKLKK